MGKKIVTTEKLIAKLIGYDGSGTRYNQMVEKKYDMIEVSKVIFTSGVYSNKIKDLLPHLRIYTRILWGVFTTESKRILQTTSMVTNNIFSTILLMRRR